MSNDTLNDILAGRTFAEPERPASNVVKLEVGDEFIGTYVKFTEHPSQLNPDKTSKLFFFTKPNGDEAVIWGKGNLAWGMSAVPAGALVKIVREADEKPEGSKFISSTFKVYVAQ